MTYSPSQDARDSYLAAIEAMRIQLVARKRIVAALWARV